MVALVSDESPKLQAVGCRGVARAAQRNVASCKHLLQLDAPKHVMATCKAAAQPILEGASEGSNAATAAASLLKRDWF